MEGMTNLQNIPADDIDFQNELPHNEEKSPRRPTEDAPPVPPDKLPSAPVSEPPTNQKPIGEKRNEPLRIARAAYTAYERRIF